MKAALAQYVADFLAANGVSHVFTVVGGGAMYLNDAFGHHKKLHCIYNHHEQASAMAAESYARIHGALPLVCVTSGPGATNAITGVAGAWVDSIPMLVISGQTKTALTVQSSGLPLRSLGNQEIDIIPIVRSITKYSVMITDPYQIRYELEKAICLAKEGRPGPCWLDIPIDVQNAMVDTDALPGMSDSERASYIRKEATPNEISDIIQKLHAAKRPVLYAGSAIRTSGGYAVFKSLVEKLGIPVVTCWNSIDLIPDDHPLYTGRAGIMGDRAGNFAVQNSDCILSLGSRLNIYQVGYNVKTWAREAFTIVVDIDEAELEKKTVRIDMPVCADVRCVMEQLCEVCANETSPVKEEWINRCALWKKRYPVVTDKQYSTQELTNVYAFMDTLSGMLPDDAITVVANGSASVVGSQSYHIREGQRFIMNCALSSMGYDLPAAIGACVANDSKPVVCIAGDGSIQMNLQELQTIITNRLPIKIFVINNGGYHQIRQTQTNLFNKRFVGIGAESNDLGFPDLCGLAAVYGYAFSRCMRNQDIPMAIDATLGQQGPAICEVVVTREQVFEPKSATKRLPSGILYSPPLEDMAPFLPREELRENMIIQMVKET